MNTKLLLLAISVAAFSSCTTLYKSGQTPDDVYYSPVRPATGGGYVDQRNDQRNDQVTSYYGDDRVIRMGINDYRWRYLDNNYNYSNSLFINDYSYTPYSYGYNYGYYYNPYFYPYPVYNYGGGFIKNYNPKNTTPRMTSLSGYNPLYNNQAVSANHGGVVRPSRTYNNSNNNRGSAVGNVIRQVFSPTNNNNRNNSNNSNNNSSNNNRTYTPSSSNSSSSGSSSSGSGGGSVSRPPRN
ncbi:MAG: hypothetical protein ABI707_18435 [Ferruginibacter sp.]